MLGAKQPVLHTDEGIEITIDTGAEVSLIKENALEKMDKGKVKKMKKQEPILTDVNDRIIPTFGSYWVTVEVGGKKVQIPVIKVSDELNFGTKILLGMDAIKITKMKLDFDNNKVEVEGVSKTLEERKAEANGEKFIMAVKRTKHKRKAPLRVRVLYEQRVPPKTRRKIRVRIFNGRNDNFLVKPHRHMEGVMEEGLIETGEKGYGDLEVENESKVEIIWKRNTTVGVAEEVDVYELDSKVIGKIGIKETKSIKEIVEEIEPHVKCDTDDRKELLQLLAEFRDVVALPGEPLGRTHLAELSLKLIEGAKPIALAPYKIPHSKEEVLNDEVDKLLTTGLVQPSVSPWSFPVVLVNKPDGSIRLCVDYRKLNAITESDQYPLPVIQDMIMDLGNSRTFSQLDLVQAYHQVPLSDETRPMTAFRTKSHHLEYVVAPFGLKQMPAVFQRLINRIFNVKPTRKYVSAYLDDLLVHSTKPEEHLAHLKDVLSKLREAGLKIKIAKCNFFQSQVKYLGYTVTSNGFKPQLEKVLAIKEFKTPKSVEDIRSFLGMAG